MNRITVLYRFPSNCFTDAPTKFHSDRFYLLFIYLSCYFPASIVLHCVFFCSVIPNSLVECPRLNAIKLYWRSLHAKSHYILFHFTYNADTKNNLKFVYCFPQRFVHSEKAITATTIRSEFRFEWEFQFRFFQQQKTVMFPHILHSQDRRSCIMLGTMSILILKRRFIEL